MRKILSIVFVCVLALHANAINVVFRLDDPTLQSGSVSMRAVKLFNEKQVPLSIAMVACDKQEQPILPTTADSLYMSKLQDRNIELTLHGFNHQVINHQGEFGGLSYVEAQRRLRIGGGYCGDVFRRMSLRLFLPLMPLMTPRW